MPKRTPTTGEKNLIGKRLIELRRQHHMSQRLLAYKLQLRGYDMDKNVITRIETNKRYVTDIELKALTEIFDVSYERRLRKQYNYTQAQIGKKLHITHQAYSNYETGVREPNLQLLAELSWIYHTSVDSLITQYCNAKNPSSVEVKNYFCIKIENSENDILLTKNEVNLLLKYRSAGEAERKLAHEALDFTER